ncbi:CPBP family intramembrane glutamic endopeptidase [Actinomadura oligospora]|uniref:CPBP family intramembrane glutamic endopeptidase n=1 Tax=Actinomadura oligospora TaxID=111804 RepID=UPI0004B8E927|nr:CPBP family intramembrane glutamic endopeptidase [Actinomadura oligospora]
MSQHPGPPDPSDSPQPPDPDGWARPDASPPSHDAPPPQSHQPQEPQPQWQWPQADGPQGPQPGWPQGHTPTPQPQPQPQGQYPPGPGPYAPGPYPHGYGYGAQSPYPYGYGYQQVKQPWADDPPPGRSFHQLARTERNRWWRPLVGSLFVLAGAFVAMFVLLVPMMIVWRASGHSLDETGKDGSIFGNTNADLVFNLLGLALLIPVAAFGAWWIQRRRPGTLLSVTGRIRWRWLLACCGLSLAFLVVSFGLSVAAGALGGGDDGGDGGHWVGWGKFLVPAVAVLLLVPFQASAEEIVFRGWLVQAVGAYTLEGRAAPVARALSRVLRTPWPGIVVAGVAFAFGHDYTGWGPVDIFMFGAILGWLAVRTGGLESGMAVHIFNNVMSFLFPAALGTLDLDQGSVGFLPVLADVTALALYALAVTWLARRMGITNRTPSPEHDRPQASQETQASLVSQDDDPEPQNLPQGPGVAFPTPAEPPATPA